jgi:hypothetical protein
MNNLGLEVISEPCPEEREQFTEIKTDIRDELRDDNFLSLKIRFLGKVDFI